jgi:multimeric flavodoxin WrbA
MKILAVNGSGRGAGNTETILSAMGRLLPEEVEFEVINLKDYQIKGCTGCEGCAITNRCVLKDDMVRLYPKIEAADGLILGSPTYFYNISASMKAFIERLYCYEVFDADDRSVWVSATEGKGLKYSAVVAVCEQDDAVDMGFTAEAMSLPLQAVGYRVVSVHKVLHLFGRHEARSEEVLLNKAAMYGLKLYKTIKLSQ